MQPVEPEIPVVAVDEVDDLVASGALLVDVRERNEWDAGRIPGAEFMPMSTINDWVNELPRDREIIFYCRSDNRSGRVVKALITQAGFGDVHNMKGGIIAWANAGLDVETPDS